MSARSYGLAVPEVMFASVIVVLTRLHGAITWQSGEHGVKRAGSQQGKRVVGSLSALQNESLDTRCILSAMSAINVYCAFAVLSLNWE